MSYELPTLYKYRVWLRSMPGMYAQYDGKVEVYASGSNEAIDRAFDKLKRGSFPDRSRDMWKIESVERVYE